MFDHQRVTMIWVHQPHFPSLSSSHLAVRLHHQQIWFLPPRNPHRGSQLRWSFRQLLVENCARTHSHLPKLHGRIWQEFVAYILHKFHGFQMFSTRHHNNHIQALTALQAKLTASTHTFAHNNFTWGLVWLVGSKRRSDKQWVWIIPYYSHYIHMMFTWYSHDIPWHSAPFLQCGHAEKLGQQLSQHPTAPWALGIHPVPAEKISDLSENLREPGLPGIQVDNLAILTVHQIQVVSWIKAHLARPPKF